MCCRAAAYATRCDSSSSTTTARRSLGIAPGWIRRSCRKPFKLRLELFERGMKFCQAFALLRDDLCRRAGDERFVGEPRAGLGDLALEPRDLFGNTLALGCDIDLDVEHELKALDDFHGSVAPWQGICIAHVRQARERLHERLVPPGKLGFARDEKAHLLPRPQIGVAAQLPNR